MTPTTAALAPKRQKTRPLALVAAAFLAAVATPAMAQSITGLGFLPGASVSQAFALSADGRAVAGYATLASGDRAISVLGTDPMEDLGVLAGDTSAYAWGISADGSIIVGQSGGTVDHAFRWTRSSDGMGGVMQGLGSLAPGAASVANATSSNGSVVVGMSGSTAGNRAFRWTQAGGMISLGTVTGAASSAAYDVSADGSVVVGSSGASSAERAARWTQATGLVSIGTLPGGTTSRAFGVSADGSTIVGFSRVTRERAFRWTSDGMQDLGILPGGISFAYAASADGSVIVGRATTGLESHGAIWISDVSGGGIMDLNLYLPSLGIDLSEWLIQDATGVSDDGLTICGNGIHNGVFEAYVARLAPLPPACPADFNLDGFANSQDFFDFLAAFFALLPAADVNHDTFINSQDFFDFLAAFFAGC